MEAIIKTISIKNDYEFRRVYKKGRSFVNSSLVVYILNNKRNKNRVGITTSRKIGNAVVRNHDRRIIREAFAQLEFKIPLGYDIVFVARGRTDSLKTQDLLRIITGIFVSAKLIQNKNQHV